MIVFLLLVSAGLIAAHKLPVEENRFAVKNYEDMSTKQFHSQPFEHDFEISDHRNVDSEVDNMKSARSKRSSSQSRLFTWKIENYPTSNITVGFHNIEQEFEEIVEKSFKLWSDVANFTARKAEPGEDASIVYRFDPNNFSLAYATPIRHPCLISYNTAIIYSSNLTNAFVEGESLYYVTAHELGHCLGLGHFDSPEAPIAIMAVYKAVDMPGPELVLSEKDTENIINRFGPSAKYLNRTPEEIKADHNTRMRILFNQMAIRRLVTRRDENKRVIKKLNADLEKATNLNDSAKIKEELIKAKTEERNQLSEVDDLYKSWKSPEMEIKFRPFVKKLAFDYLDGVIIAGKEDIKRAEGKIKAFEEISNRTEEQEKAYEIELNYLKSRKNYIAPYDRYYQNIESYLNDL